MIRLNLYTSITTLLGLTYTYEIKSWCGVGYNLLIISSAVLKTLMTLGQI